MLQSSFHKNSLLIGYYRKLNFDDNTIVLNLSVTSIFIYNSLHKSCLFLSMLVILPFKYNVIS